MRIDWWTLGFQTVNVLVLVWLLSRFLFKPVAQIIADRQQQAAALMRDATNARASASIAAATARPSASAGPIAPNETASAAAMMLITSIRLVMLFLAGDGRPARLRRRAPHR